MKPSNIVGTLFMTLAFAAGAAEIPAMSHNLTKQATRTLAPALKLHDINGQSHDLAALKGNVVLINFWATWCPPCRQEMPSIARLAERLHGKRFTVLAVDIGEDADTIQNFISQLDTSLPFPVLLDPDAKIMQTWNISGLPTTYLIDRKGRIAYSAAGGREFDHPEIEQLVRNLLRP
ncbi:MAG: TlpA family protein disulfide reductase [Thiobacillus sp.]